MSAKSGRPSSSSLAPLLLVGSMISLTIGAAIAKRLFHIIGPCGTTFLRLSISAVIVSLIAKPWRVRIDRRGWLTILLYGFNIGLMNLFFYEAIERLPIGVAIAIEFLGPLGVALYYSRSRLDFGWSALALTGIALLLPLTKVSANLDLKGVLFASIAAAFWALYIVVGKRAGQVASAGRVTALGLMFGALLILPFGAVEAAPIFSRPELLLPAFAVGVFSGAIPFSFEMMAFSHMDAKNFGILVSLEPAIGAVSAYFYLNENLDAIQLLAIACVIAASIGSSVSATRSKQRAAAELVLP